MITENSKEDCEKFYMFRDDILGDGMCEDVQRECRFCDRYIHSESDCNLLTFKPKRVNTILRKTFSLVHYARIPKKRKCFSRDTRKGGKISYHQSWMVIHEGSELEEEFI
jgi:hypothetical protein